MSQGKTVLEAEMESVTASETSSRTVSNTLSVTLTEKLKFSKPDDFECLDKCATIR